MHLSLEYSSFGFLDIGFGGTSKLYFGSRRTCLKLLKRGALSKNKSGIHLSAVVCVETRMEL